MKFVFSDVDGTFQDLGAPVPAVNIAAVNALQQQGHHFVFVTGRSYDLVQKMQQELGLECDVIFGNGAGLKKVGQPPRYTNGLSLAACREIVDKLEAADIFYFIHTDQEILLKPFSRYQKHFQDLRASLAFMGEQGQQLMDFKEDYFTNDCTHVADPVAFLAEHPKRHIVKIELMVPDDEAHPELRAALGSPEAYIFQSFYKTLEIVDPKSTKGAAIETYLQEYQPAVTYGIGDGENDLPMLQAVDIAVAVENASEVIKEQCHVIADSCQAGGVGKFIFEHVLKEVNVL